MAYPTDRVQLFDRDMNPLRELAPSEVFSRVRTEEINGEHSLVITTTRRLEEGWRALTVDGMGKWREWVLTEPDQLHESGKTAVGTYRFVWSLQHDLTESYVHADAVSVGLGNSMSSQQVASAVLNGVAQWSVGSCDAPSISENGVVFIYESAWSKLSKVVEATGWEVDSAIEVSNLYGVTARKLILTSHVGSTDVTRRFDWGEDVSEIHRTPDPGPYYCRVVPLGKGQTEYADDDETTFEWPMDITDETGDPSLFYIEDTEAALVFRRSDGNGGWIYPTTTVSYSEDDPELLLAAATEDLHNHTRPNVTYEASVVQLARAGMDVHGVALGDDIQIVDCGFNPDAALRLQGRVTAMEVDELSPETNTQLTIGNLRDSITYVISKTEASLGQLIKSNSEVVEQIASMATARYVDELLNRINTEINATGGYAYFVPGEGVITYDVAVADPLVGSNASQVVQIKGGSIRIANSKKASFSGIDDWNWRTVFTAGHIAADLVTASAITTGYIGDVNGDVYWDLDNQFLSIANGEIDAGLITSGKIQSHDGSVYFDLTNNELVCSKISQTASFYQSGHTAHGTINIDVSVMEGSPSSSTGYMNGHPYAQIVNPDNNDAAIRLLPADSSTRSIWAGETTYQSAITTKNADLHLAAYCNYPTGYLSTTGHNDTQLHLGDGVIRLLASNSIGMYGIDIKGSTQTVNVTGTFTATGTKSRSVKTKDYGNRLLYCYETPTPMFGDIGNGVIDDDGTCYVLIDDIFSETARTDISYQVFLQKCGEGDIWVSEKHRECFVVKGTPNLAFDWEIKCKQVDYEGLRLESVEMIDADAVDNSELAVIEGIYDEESDFVGQIESAYA